VGVKKRQHDQHGRKRKRVRSHKKIRRGRKKREKESKTRPEGGRGGKNCRDFRFLAGVLDKGGEKKCPVGECTGGGKVKQEMQLHRVRGVAGAGNG